MICSARFSIDRLAWEDAGPIRSATRFSFTPRHPAQRRGQQCATTTCWARVATLERGPLISGRQRLTWDGRDPRGHRAPPGVYLLRAEQGREARMRRLFESMT